MPHCKGKFNTLAPIYLIITTNSGDLRFIPNSIFDKWFQLKLGSDPIFKALFKKVEQCGFIEILVVIIEGTTSHLS